MMVRLLCLGVRAYQILVSPVLHWVGGPGSGCRFDPSCSEYMIQALRRHGALRGGWLGLKRLARCHPWGGCGCDPVPPRGCKSRACADNTGSPNGGNGGAPPPSRS